LSIDETDTRGWQDAGGGMARAYLQRFLQEDSAGLQTIIRGYVIRMQLAMGNNVEVVAAEVFQETVVEVLAHADRFNPAMQPRAWFLAIAANILKRHRTNYAKRYRFEVLQSDLASQQDILDRLMNYPVNAPGPEQAFVSHEGVRELLALVAQEDRDLLLMTLIQGWDARAIAEAMKITPGAARVRIHRALSRLREAWYHAEQQRKEHER